MLIGCRPNTDQRNASLTVSSETTSTASLLPGLWSQDVSGSLSDSGFYFSPYGTFELIASEKSGFWKLGADTELLTGSLTSDTDTVWTTYRIMESGPERLVLEQSGVKSIYRKVPFGQSDEPVILTGFMGRLQEAMPERSKQIELPPTKRVTVKLSSTDPAVVFEWLQDGKRYTRAPARNWSGIMVRGGTFEIRIKSNAPGKISSEGVEYEVKVLTQ